MTHFSLIAAVGENLELGGNQSLLWEQPKDLQRFKALTLEHPVVMGRKTWESLSIRPLPRRRNIVLSRQADFSPAQAEIANSVETVIRMTSSEDETFIIGGAEIYQLFLPLASTIYLTRILEVFAQADRFFPKINLEHWELKDELFVEQDEANRFAMMFQCYKRINEHE